MGSVRHDDFVRRLEPHLVVVDIATFGEHHGDALTSVVGAAAAHAHQAVGVQLTGRLDRPLHHLNGRVGGHAREETGAIAAQGLLYPLHHVGLFQDGRAADEQGAFDTQPVQGLTDAGNGVAVADYFLSQPRIAILQSRCNFH